MQVGRWKVQAVLEGSFLLDGGSMFGIVPRPLWTKLHPADEQGRIVMALRTLVLRGEGGCVLVDCGMGPRFSGKLQEIYRYRSSGAGLEGALAGLGVEPPQITDVIATHLHFDHVAGLLEAMPDGTLRPRFPRARVHVQHDCWDWALRPCDWDRSSFFPQDLQIWEKQLDLRLLRGETEILPGISVQPTCGHMPGHQIVIVEEGPGALVFCADLIPTAAHLKLPYIMAYDHRPLETLEEKKILLARALEGDWMLVFEHDPKVVACRVVEKGGVAVQGPALCPQF